jgi:broad specificity phosphatase PhoE
MNREEKLSHALKLAREDLWFLMNNASIEAIFRERAMHTAEFITETLGDETTFEPIKQRWFKEADFGGRAMLQNREVRSYRNGTKRAPA